MLDVDGSVGSSVVDSWEGRRWVAFGAKVPHHGLNGEAAVEAVDVGEEA